MNDSFSNYSASRVFAIVPAAGVSRRMGAPKQTLDVGGRSMLAAALEPLLASTAAGAAVVTRAELVAPLLEELQGRQSPGLSRLVVAINDDPESGMIDSVRLGIAKWERKAQPGPRDGFMIVPGDLPGLTPEIVDRCIGVFAASPGRIVVAAHSGKGGHPMIFPQAMALLVQSDACDGGLNVLKSRFAELLTLVECNDPAVVRNVNTPEDYRELPRQRGSAPGPPPSND